MLTTLKISPLVAVVLLGGCVALPTGPSVMALPGTGKNFDQFRYDDNLCRQYAYDQVGGLTANQAATDSAVNSAVVGTWLGAALGLPSMAAAAPGQARRPGCYLAAPPGPAPHRAPPMAPSDATTTLISSACTRTAKKSRSRAVTSTSSVSTFPIRSVLPCLRIWLQIRPRPRAHHPLRPRVRRASSLLKFCCAW